MKKNVLYALLSFNLIFGGCDKKNPAEELIDEVVEVVLPTVKTLPVNNITIISASGGGSIETAGSGSIIDRGLVLSKTTNPTAEDKIIPVNSVTGAGSFVSNIEGLEPLTKYYVRAFARNRGGIAYGEEIEFTTLSDKPPVLPKVLLDSTSFDSEAKFKEFWKSFYPWGTDHNGSARMYEKQVSILPDGVLQIVADRTEEWEGYSTADPWLRIFYHSGAVHMKEHITVSDTLPYWEISGDFQVPTVEGSWPAFWITGANSWPPESDIMEFKGSSTNWQNTATGPNWQNVTWQNKLTVVNNAHEWHNYKITMTRMNQLNVSIDYFIDNVKTDTHTANFMNQPFWLIINMQMGGSSGATGAHLQQATMKGRNIYVAAYREIP